MSARSNSLRAAGFVVAVAAMLIVLSAMCVLIEPRYLGSSAAEASLRGLGFGGAMVGLGWMVAIAIRAQRDDPRPPTPVSPPDRSLPVR